MQKLNLRSPKPYDMSDQSETEQPRIRFYCVSEGATEESYFRGVRNNKIQLSIKNDVYINVVEKQEGQETLSHPLQLVKSCLYQMGYIDSEEHELPKDKWMENCKWDGFDREIDQVCVIFDQDYRGLEKYFDEIFGLCEKYKIQVVMSTPNFELWLLMHFPDIKQYDEKLLLENPKNLKGQLFENASRKKKYLEILLSNCANGYSKGQKIHFEKFLPFIDTAISQASLYPEDSKKLTDKLGTSVGKLLRQMRG